jgi:signal transduction histidine kinase
MNPSDQALVAFRLRTVRLGIVAALILLAAMVPYVLLPGRGISQGPALVLVGLGLLIAGSMAALPWRRLFRRGVATWFLYGYSVAGVLILTVLLGAMGPSRLAVFFLYAFTTIFFSFWFPIRGQVALLLFTWTSYLAALGFAGWPVGAADVVARLVLLGVLAATAAFLSRELTRYIAEHAEARRESEGRAEMLATVARAARQVTALDSELVLEAVVRGASALGFESVSLNLYDDDRRTHRVAHALGLPEEFVRGVHPTDRGIVGRVLERRQTVVMDDYPVLLDALPRLPALDFHVVVATPVWVQARLAAALVAGTGKRRRIKPGETEAIEMLAALAGRALENARRFEDEHRTVERLGELDRLKSDFISTVSHELRTPLTAIEGMGFTLEEQWRALDDELRRELLARLNANARTLHQIINTLLDFSRIEAGRMEVNVEMVPLLQHVEAVVGRLGSLLASHPVSVRVPDGLVVRVDPILLDRVIENLVANAAKHTPAETEVEVSADADGGEAVVRVADSGPGIPQAELRYLGDRFFRGGDPNRRTGGTGLGLALVQELLRLHDSKLEIESEIGRGSQFSFRLPLAQISEGEGPSPTPEAAEDPA